MFITMRKLIVVAALIKVKYKYLIGLRSTGKYINLWEFPGGKVEGNEDHKAALVREIKEEFNVDIEVKNLIKKIEHQYPEFYLEMYCYECSLITDNFILNDHSEIMWFDPKNPIDLDWLPADIAIVEYLKSI